MPLREMRQEDLAQIGRVLAANGLRTPAAGQWRSFWEHTPDEGRLASIPKGWVLEDDHGTIVGTFRNVAFEYEWNRRPIRAVVASAWAVDAAHRRASLQLATAYFRQKGVELLLNTTAVEATSGKAFLAFGAERVPQPTYTERLLWVTGYRGFARSLLRGRRMPAAAILSYPAASAMWLLDRIGDRNHAARIVPPGIGEAHAFDDRFDRFWNLHVRARPNRLQAVRDASTLAWRVALERPERPPLIVTLAGGPDLDGYAILVRRDDERRVLRRFELVDLQARDDDEDRLRTLMRGALRLAHERDVHVVAISGLHERKRRALEPLKPHHNPTPGWPLYYKALDPELREGLRSPDAWDVSMLDGDILWSGVFES